MASKIATYVGYRTNFQHLGLVDDFEAAYKKNRCLEKPFLRDEGLQEVGYGFEVFAADQ